MMRCARITVAALAVLLAGMLCGCQSDGFVVGTTITVIDLTGSYRSATTVGELGTLTLLLERVEETRVFRAQVSGALVDSLEPSDGIGTLGDLHIILNFNRGEESDYYFEGTITLADGVAASEATATDVTGITGNFVFPDQTETLAVEFVPQG